MHMPGHKRNPDIAADTPASAFLWADITEIDGFDDLSDPQGVLLETAQLASELYGSEKAFVLVNGSTLGNLAAIGAHTQRGDKILTDTYCHKSIKNAARLFGLELITVTPQLDPATSVPCSIPPAAVETALHENPDIKLVTITSPSYEGVISDISGIADVAHKAGALLHVDCAHGAHLGFSDLFPQNPTALGADTVVVSLHKTLPSLTQSALLHICSAGADILRVKEMLDILQTSSPSYILMASVDECLRLLSKDADRLFNEYKENLTYFKERVKNLKHLSILGSDKTSNGFFGIDPGKIVIIAKNNAEELAQRLRTKYKIELERAYKDYAVAMTSFCDTREGFARLADALVEIDEK